MFLVVQTALFYEIDRYVEVENMSECFEVVGGVHSMPVWVLLWPEHKMPGHDPCSSLAGTFLSNHINGTLAALQLFIVVQLLEYGEAALDNRADLVGTFVKLVTLFSEFLL
jgi:hypothetical protein